MKNICIYIPARNVEKTLGSVIDRIPKNAMQAAKEILIVDNCSKDNTYEVAKRYKKKIGKITIIRNEKDLNYGGSQKKAYSYAIKKGYDAVVMLHGDAQYPPEQVPELLETLARKNADMVQGSRTNLLKGKMPAWRFAGNRLLTLLEKAVLGMDLGEFHSGFRVYRCSTLKKIPFDRCSSDYNFDSDIIMQLRLKNCKVADIKIPTHYGADSNSPSIKETFNYSWGIVAALYRYLLHKYGIKKIDKFDF